MILTAERLLDALERSAATRYGGEIVSELEHALQCAELAREAGADDDLQLACLLHDVGRFAVDQALVSDTTERTAVGTGARGHHEVGADLLASWVPERVAWCVRMHADAKRYLCADRAGVLRSSVAGVPAHPANAGRASCRRRPPRGSPPIRGCGTPSRCGGGTIWRR
jgi:predicted HD phosphohydrolase